MFSISLLIPAVVSATPMRAPAIVFDEQFAAPIESAGPLRIFVNGGGVTLSNGYSDSKANTSPLAVGTRTLAPSGLSDGTWSELMTCVREAFGPFDAIVTDADPGNARHIELVVAASSAPLGFELPISGVAPFACTGVDNAIAFTFVDATGASARNLCWTAVQEIGHTLGLEHVLLCGDPMTYMFGCPNNTFQNVDARCGESEARPCECGATTQNSYGHLFALLGEGDTAAPTLAVTSPAPGAEVDAGFAVAADALDSYTVTRMRVEVDGVPIGEDFVPPWEVVVPARAGAGPHRIRTVVRDPAGNIATDDREVTVRAECSSDDNCGDDQLCITGVCLGEVGASCVDDGRCAVGPCRGDLDHPTACRATCRLGDDTTCATGDTCEYIDGAAVCMPPAPIPDAGCSTSGASSLFTLAGGVFFLPMFRRRRRQEGSP